MSNPYTLLIVDDDPIVAEGVAMSVAEPGRRILICHDLDTASMVIEQDRIDVVIADIRFGNDFSYYGLEFLDFVRRESSRTQVILMSGAATDGLEAEAIGRGASGFLRKPFLSAELETLLRDAPAFEAGSDLIHVPTLDQMIDGGMIHMIYQPIVELATRRVEGYEALARVRTGSLMSNPENLFAYASRAGRIFELEAHCLAAAIDTGKSLTDQAKLFLNVHPRSFEKSLIVHTIEQAIKAAGISPERIVLEVTEQGAIRSRQSMDQILALKAMGIAFALDDIGVAFSHLPYIDQIAPTWIKISQLFGTGFEKERTKVKIVHNLANLASAFDANLILEGVETEDTAAAAAEARIEYAQGYHFARPQPVGTWESLSAAGQLPASVSLSAAV